MAGFETRSSRLLHEAGFLQLVEARLGTPGGSEVVRFVVRHPGAVAVVPVDGEGRAVLVRQYRVAAGRELLEVPAGKRDVRGEPPEATAARELEEEVGLRPGRLVKLGEFFNSPGFCDEYTHVFLATELVEGGREAELKAEERHLVVERVPLDAVEELVMSGDLVDAKTIVGLLLARSHLGQAEGGPPGR